MLNPDFAIPSKPTHSSRLRDRKGRSFSRDHNEWNFDSFSPGKQARMRSTRFIVKTGMTNTAKSSGDKSSCFAAIGGGTFRKNGLCGGSYLFVIHHLRGALFVRVSMSLQIRYTYSRFEDTPKWKYRRSWANRSVALLFYFRLAFRLFTVGPHLVYLRVHTLFI